jgi:hypothetical protein
MAATSPAMTIFDNPPKQKSRRCRRLFLVIS